MADNVAITAGSGTTVLADEVTDGTLGTGVVQMMKLMDGTINGTNKVVVNAAGELGVVQIDTTATGTITANDTVVAAPAGAGALVTGASTAGSLVSIATYGGESAWTVMVTGLTSGSLWFEGSLDSTTGTDGNWISLNGHQQGIIQNTIANVATVNGIWRGNIAGLKYFRVRSKATLTGTPAISIRVSDGPATVILNSSLPVGTNSIGTVVLGAGAASVGVLGAGANVIGAVSIGTTTGKTIQAANASLATTATTADQVIATRTVTSGKTFYISSFKISAFLTTPAATYTDFGSVSLELPSGTKIWTGRLQGTGNDRVVIPVFESLFGTSLQVVRLVVTPAAATPMTFFGNIVGTEK